MVLKLKNHDDGAYIYFRKISEKHPYLLEPALVPNLKQNNFDLPFTEAPENFKGRYFTMSSKKMIEFEDAKLIDI